MNYYDSPPVLNIQIILDDLDLTNRDDQIRIKILVAQFNLFVMMCRGANTEIIEYLEHQEGIVREIGIQANFDFIMKAIKHTDDFPELRAKLIELLRGNNLHT